MSETFTRTAWVQLDSECGHQEQANRAWDARMDSGVYEEIEALSSLHGNVPAGKASDSSQGSDSDDSGSLEVLQRYGICLHEVLGRGVFGKVYKGALHGRTVAVKLVELTAPRGEAKAQLSEAKIATSLQHPNVVHLHKAIVEQVRVARRSLRSRSSATSRASSDFGEAASPARKYTWSAGADGPLTPQGGVSPVRLNPSNSAPTAGIAALSYNRITSVQARSNSDVAMVSPMALSPRSSDSSPVPPMSAFQAGMPPQPPKLEQVLAEAAAASASLPSAPRPPHSPELKPRSSQGARSSQEGDRDGRQGVGAGKSQSLVTYRCIFVMEFCDTGTLWAALQRGMYHDDNGSPKLHAILTTALEVCQGVAYMHSHRVVHRDLTSGNVLLMREPMAQRVKAKVSDFGLSMLMRPGQDHARAVQHGTLAYMPPELILEDAISFATDVYSFGILLWEMFSMKTPYMGMSEEQIIQRKVHEAVDMEAPPCAPAAVAELMQKCLDRRPCQRPTFLAIKSSLHALLATFWLDE